MNSSCSRTEAAERCPAPTMAALLLASTAALCASCKAEAPKAIEAQLSSDLPAGTVDQILRAAAANGGPQVERIAGLGLGASALAPASALDGGAAPDGGTASGAAPGAVAGDGGATTVSTAMTASVATPAPSTAPALAAGGDVRWDLEPYGAIAAAAKGELLPMPAAGAEVPDLWRDRNGTWVAVGGRAQVLLVGTDSLGDHAVPVRFTALTEPWLKGKVALRAPTDGAALAHFAALYQAWGEERMRAWLEGLRENAVQLLANDDEVRLAVVQGRAVVGVLGSDAAAKAAASAAHVEVVYPNQKSIGTFVWPTALSLPRNPAHPEAAARLAEKLADRATEQLLVAREPGFLPLRPNIPTPPGVRSASNLVVISVEPQHIVEEINRRRDELGDWVAAVRAQTPPTAPRQ